MAPNLFKKSDVRASRRTKLIGNFNQKTAIKGCLLPFVYRQFVYGHFVHGHFVYGHFVYGHFVYEHFVYGHFV
jgi:hypothetical protein